MCIILLQVRSFPSQLFIVNIMNPLPFMQWNTVHMAENLVSAMQAKANRGILYVNEVKLIAPFVHCDFSSNLHTTVC